MSGLMILLGVVLAIVIVSGAFRLENTAFRAAAGVFALIILLFFITLSSFRHVGQNEVGIVVKNLGAPLPPGAIIAVNGEMGTQAEILGPGWHLWLWPGLYDVELAPVTTIRSDEVGIITAADGRPLPQGMAFAPEWSKEEFGDMQNAEYFLTTGGSGGSGSGGSGSGGSGSGGGYKGPQSSVLSPGDYRLNTRLFHIERVPVTNIEKSTVGVVKSNVGDPPEDEDISANQLVKKGERGIWKAPYMPQKLYLNTKAYEVTMISTKIQIILYGSGGVGDLQEIKVRTADSFEIPVDVRIEYHITPQDAALVVSTFGDDGKMLQTQLASTVRAIFRNNAEKMDALAYVNQRSEQETATTKVLSEEMAKVGVTIDALRIGQIELSDSPILAKLLETQTDRAVAEEEQETFKVQQLAAEQQKALSRTMQEAEEEKRLATEEYEKKMEEVRAQRVVVEAKGAAESIAIRAKAQAEAYAVIAKEIGRGNAALIELLKIIGEKGINITPRVMITGGANGSASTADGQTTALIGTMLDSMISKEEGKK